MKKIFLVLGIVALLFASCGSSPSSTNASKEPDLTGVTSYYVRADGNDSNVGTSEDKPFKTLAKAVSAASKTKVKTITVIGKLVGQTDIKDSGTDEILITGKSDATDSEKAVLTTLTKETSAIQITENSNIRLEYITLNTGAAYPIIVAVGNKIKLTLGKDVVVSGNGKDANYKVPAGGGIAMFEGTLIMMDNATVTNCFARLGGGIIISGGKMFLQDNVVISNNYAEDSGGGVLVQKSNLEIKNNAVIKNNIAERKHLDFGGGGIYCTQGTIKLQDNSSVTENTAPYGGGIYLKMSSIQTADGVKVESSGVYESRQVTGNKATEAYLDGKIPHNILLNNH